jgi:hypothetical protein
MLHARMSMMRVASSKPKRFGVVAEETEEQNDPHERCQNCHAPTRGFRIHPIQ